MIKERRENRADASAKILRNVWNVVRRRRKEVTVRLALPIRKLSPNFATWYIPRPSFRFAVSASQFADICGSLQLPVCMKRCVHTRDEERKSSLSSLLYTRYRSTENRLQTTDCSLLTDPVLACWYILENSSDIGLSSSCHI